MAAFKKGIGGTADRSRRAASTAGESLEALPELGIAVAILTVLVLFRTIGGTVANALARCYRASGLDADPDEWEDYGEVLGMVFGAVSAVLLLVIG